MTGNEIRLGPDDLVGREFAIGLRGYDRDEVDSFLARAADAWRASMSSAPAMNGLSSSAMAALADTEAPAPVALPVAAEEPAPAPEGYVDPFAGPVLADPFAAPAPSDPFAAPAPTDSFAAPAPPPEPESPIADLFAAPEPEPVPEIDVRTPVAEPVSSFDQAVVETSRVEAERDRTAAFAERKAAELDRANARTELARAQEDALHVIDQAQRRAEAVLTGARDKARAEAEAVLEDARSRLTPLLEQERAVRARLARLRSELDAIVGGSETDAPAPALSEPTRIVSATEDDPETPEAPFPVGFGSVSVGQ